MIQFTQPQLEEVVKRKVAFKLNLKDETSFGR